MTDTFDSRALGKTDAFGQRLMRPGTYRFDVLPPGKAVTSEHRPYEIREGDMVLWCCRDTGAPPFTVIGDQPFFDSRTLTNECGYAHAFSAPGEYRWVDANGSDLGGTVTVAPVTCGSEKELAAWQRTLSSAALVMISDGRADPPEVEIVMGQTVFFVVVKTEGVTVTDARLVEASTTVHDQLATAGYC